MKSGYRSSVTYYPQPEPRPGLIIAAIAAGLLLVLAIAFVIYAFLSTRPTPAEPPASPAVLAEPIAAAEAVAIVAPTAALEPPAVVLYDDAGDLVEVRTATGQILPRDQWPAELPPTLGRTLTPGALIAAAEALHGLAFLEGAAYDAARRELVLFGRPGTSTFNFDDLRVALASAYGRQDPTVSIDPGPTPDEMVVSFTGPVEDTHFGLVMYEADRRMKTLGLGQDNETGVAVSSNVPGFRTQLDLAIELERDLDRGAAVWDQFWFVPVDMTLERGPNSAIFTESRLRVDRRCLDTQYRPLETCVAPAAEAFAVHLTANYDAYAAEFDVFRQLRELGKLLSLAKWLRGDDLIAEHVVDLTWPGAQESAAVDTPETTPGITVTRTEVVTETARILTRTQGLYGGVDFQFKNRYVPATVAGTQIIQEALAARPAHGQTWAFSVADVTRQAVAVPLEELPTPALLAADAGVDVDLGAVAGIPAGLVRVASLVDVADSSFGAGWQLDAPRLFFTGAEIRAARTQDDPIEVVNDALTWKRYATAESERFAFGGWTDDGQRVYESSTGRQIIWAAGAGYLYATLQGEQRFDERGRLSELADGTRWARYRYEGERLVAITTSGGDTVALTYAGARLKVVRRGEQEWRYEYDASGRLIAVRDEEGKVLAIYEYDAAGRLVIERDSNGKVRRRNVFSAAGQLVGYERDGISYYLSTAGTLLLPAHSAVAERAEESAALAGRIGSALAELARQPDQATAIRETILRLDDIQLARLQRSLAATGQNLYVEVVDRADFAFLNGEARKLLPGDTPLRPQLYQAGDHWLMLCTEPADVTPERSAMLDRILAHGRLQRRTPDAVVLSIAADRETLRVLGRDQIIALHWSQLQSPWQRLRRALAALPFIPASAPPDIADLANRNPRRLGKLLMERGITPITQPVLVLDGDLLATNLQRALPGHNVWRTYGLDASLIASRVDYQRGLELSLNEMVLVNGAPHTLDEIKDVGKAGESLRSWRAIHKVWADVALKHGVEQAPGTAAALTGALENNPAVMVIVAHSDGLTIYLPDGSTFNAQELDDATRATIRRNGPLVGLFSCKTASIRDQRSLARSLLDAGARGVIAPAVEIPARTTSRILDRFLKGIGEHRSFLDALWNAIRGSDMQFWIGRTPSGDEPRFIG